MGVLLHYIDSPSPNSDVGINFGLLYDYGLRLTNIYYDLCMYLEKRKVLVGSHTSYTYILHALAVETQDYRDQ